MRTSQERVSIGCRVQVYSTAWIGAQPGIVVSEPRDVGVDGIEGNAQVANVNVSIDGVQNGRVLDLFRKRPEGETLEMVPVFDRLAPAARQQLAIGLPPVETALGEHCFWCEWPGIR